jgi:arginine utilization regulatory protein
MVQSCPGGEEGMEKRLADLFQMFVYILDQLNEGVHIIDQDGITILYNRKMTELESMRKEDVLGKPLTDVFQFPAGQESTLLQALRDGTVTRNVRQTYFNDKGKEITTITNTFPIWSKDSDRIVGAVEIANDVTKMERLIRENMMEQEKGGARYTFDQIIGTSRAIQHVIEHAKRAARTASSVLIVGETGTGKELFVQSIHRASARAGGPFISQNCAALPESLIESLLFGTSKGAFTGAIERPGLFEQAEGGTLFLDEINSLSIHLQAKLLRALQEHSIRRIGDTKDRAIDVRIIAAMNEDPIEAISSQRLRKDLYYRLGVVTLMIPPLRERKEDIPDLVRHFINRYNQLFQMEVLGVSEEVWQFFYEYDWPGNVRELQHMIEGAMNLMGNEPQIQMQHLPIHRRLPRFSIQSGERIADAPKSLWTLPQTNVENTSILPLKEKMEEFESAYIQSVLDMYNGNISKAAKALGVSRQSLQYRLRKFRQNQS